MSTYYSLICENCGERVEAVSRTISGTSPFGDSELTLLPFLIAHEGCAIKVVSEHNEDFHDNKYLDWTAGNFKDLHYKRLIRLRNAHNPPTDPVPAR